MSCSIIIDRRLGTSSAAGGLDMKEVKNRVQLPKVDVPLRALGAQLSRDLQLISQCRNSYRLWQADAMISTNFDFNRDKRNYLGELGVELSTPATWRGLRATTRYLHCARDKTCPMFRLEVTSGEA